MSTDVLVFPLRSGTERRLFVTRLGLNQITRIAALSGSKLGQAAHSVAVECNSDAGKLSNQLDFGGGGDRYRTAISRRLCTQPLAKPVTPADDASVGSCCSSRRVSTGAVDCFWCKSAFPRAHLFVQGACGRRSSMRFSTNMPDSCRILCPSTVLRQPMFLRLDTHRSTTGGGSEFRRDDISPSFPLP